MKRWQIMIGFGLIGLGLITLFEVMFAINLWRIIGPLILVGLGLGLIFQSIIVGSDVQVHIPFLGDLSKAGSWNLDRHEIWWFVGSNRFDFTNANFPEGEGSIRIFGLVTDITVILPKDVGLRLESTAFVSEFAGVERNKESLILTPLEYESPNYPTAEKRVILQNISFVSDIRVKRPLI